MSASSISYPRLYTDASGESHFEDVEMALEAGSFSTGAPALALSAFTQTERFVFAEFPAEGEGETLHPTPRRQMAVVLSGDVEVTASDGERRRRGPGAPLLMEDTSGRGHTSRPIGGPAQTLVIQLG
jgi:hypothetical protein